MLSILLYGTVEEQSLATVGGEQLRSCLQFQWVHRVLLVFAEECPSLSYCTEIGVAVEENHFQILYKIIILSPYINK